MALKSSKTQQSVVQLLHRNAPSSKHFINK